MMPGYKSGILKRFLRPFSRTSEMLHRSHFSFVFLTNKKSSRYSNNASRRFSVRKYLQMAPLFPGYAEISSSSTSKIPDTCAENQLQMSNGKKVPCIASIVGEFSRITLRE